jgi:circadian clock protein KaiB
VKRKKIPNSVHAFEKALASQPKGGHYLLRLYVTGSTARSARAIQNIRAICEQQLPGRYDLEVVDIYQHPEYAGPRQIVVAPTLVKELPSPVRRIIGDLSDERSVLAGLDILPQPHDTPRRPRV